MAGKRKITTLSDKMLGRVNQSIGFTEGFIREQSDGRPSPSTLSAPAGRVKLKTPLSYGQLGVGFMMELMQVGEDLRWVTTKTEVPVFAVSGFQNYWGEGSELPVVKTAAGWMVSGDAMSGRLPSTDKEPLSKWSVLKMGAVQASDWRDAVILYRPEDNKLGAFNPYWEGSYAALTGYVPEDRQHDEFKNPDFPKRKGVVAPCVPLGGHVPVRVAYEKFKGTMPNGDSIPDELLHALNAGDGRPHRTELWGPGSTGKVTRPFVAMELYWWEWVSPDYIIKSFKVQEPNSEYDPAQFEYGGVCNRWAIDGEGRFLIPNPEYSPQSDACLVSKEVDKEFWATSDECGVSVSTGVEATENPPEKRSVFWIGGKKFWVGSDMVGWDWNWFGQNWVFEEGTWRPGGYSERAFWGPAGYNWWSKKYGEFPPSQEQLDSDYPDDDPPDAPCGGVLQRNLYGYILWEWGWDTLGTVGPEADETCLVVGKMKGRSRLVVVNGETPEPST